MQVNHLDGTRQNYEGLTALQVIEKTKEALDDPTVESFTVQTQPRWQRRKDEREANRKPGKRRTYH